MKYLIAFSLLCCLSVVKLNSQNCVGVILNETSCDSALAVSDVEGLITFIDEVNAESKALCPKDYKVMLDNMHWGAYVLLSKGYYDSSIKLYTRIQRAAEIQGDTSYVLHMQAYIGNANLFKGDFRKAIDIMNEGYGQLLASKIDDPYLLGYYPHIIGGGYQYLGEYEQAMKYFHIALPALIEDDSDVLETNYLAIAEVAIKQQKFAKAEKELYRITNTTIDDLLAPGWDYDIYRSASKIVAARGEYAKAIDLLEYAEASLVDSTHWSMMPAIPMYEKSDIHVQFGNSTQGEVEILRGLEQLGIADWKNASYNNHPNLQYVLSTLTVYAKVKELQLLDDDNAEDRYELDQLYQVAFKVIELLLQDFSSRRGASLWRDYKYLYPRAIDNAHYLYNVFGDSDFLSRGLTYSVRSKSQELIDKQQNNNRREIPSDISNQLEVLQAELNSIKLDLLEAKVQGNVENIAAYSAKYGAVKEEIKTVELPYQAEVEERSIGFNINLETLDIERRAAKLEIYESDNQWDVWTITADGVDWMRHKKEEGWNEMVSQYSKEVSKGFDFVKLQESLSFLSEKFCDLMAQDINLITVIGDRTLSTIPLDLLHQCEQSDFLESDVAFNFSYSLFDFSQPEKRRTPRKYEYPVLAWAPTYNDINAADVEDQLVAELVRSGNYNLPGAQLEALAISAIMNGESIMGEKATKSSFFENIGKSRVLHLSMHALMNRDEGGLSKFLFSNDDAEQSSSYLHAFELEELSLSAELAVLSACETGLGPIDEGEGVMSLARSFAMAGVPSTVMTLWQVPDQSSSAIMTLFYRYLKEGQGKVDALSNAKKEYVRTSVDDALKHPYYWAGFVVIGDNVPVVDIESKLPFKYPIYIIAVVGVGLLTKRWLQFI